MAIGFATRSPGARSWPSVRGSPAFRASRRAQRRSEPRLSALRGFHGATARRVKPSAVTIRLAGPSGISVRRLSRWGPREARRAPPPLPVPRAPPRTGKKMLRGHALSAKEIVGARDWGFSYRACGPGGAAVRWPACRPSSLTSPGGRGAGGRYVGGSARRVSRSNWISARPHRIERTRCQGRRRPRPRTTSAHSGSGIAHFPC